MFRVHRDTITGWAKRVHIGCIRTPGGHRRFLRADIDAWINGRHPAPAAPAEPEADTTV